MKKKNIKVRRDWKINPVTKVKESNKKYDRKKAKVDDSKIDDFPLNNETEA